MHSRIVVGIDGSGPSRSAVHWALARARGTGEGVTLVHVCQLPAHAAPEARNEILQNAAALAADEGTFAAGMAAEVDLTTEVLVGTPMVELSEFSRDAALVVVGTHKTGFIHGEVYGSQTLRLAASARCPVVTVPEELGHSRQGIVVGVDDDPAGRAAIDFAAREAQRTGHPLSLIRGCPGSNEVEHHPPFSFESADTESRAMLGDALAQVRTCCAQVPVRLRVVQRPIAAALVAASGGAELTVVGASRGSGSHGLGSVAHDLLLNIAGPTVIVHAPDAGDYGPQQPSTGREGAADATSVGAVTGSRWL